MSNIDEEKIANLQAMADNCERLTAIRFLEEADWDLGRAYENVMLNNAMQGFDQPSSSAPQMDIGQFGGGSNIPPRPDQIPDFDTPM